MGTRTCTHLEGRLRTEGARGVGDLRPAQAWQPRGPGCPVGPLPLPWGRKGGIVFVLEAGARSAAQCGSCGLRACGTAHRARGPPPPPAPLRLPARLPSHGHASLCPSRLVSSEEVRCVLVGSSVPGRGWRRSAGVESSAHSPWGRAALPMASGALGLAGGTLHWTRGCRWGPRGLLFRPT